MMVTVMMAWRWTISEMVTMAAMVGVAIAHHSPKSCRAWRAGVGTCSSPAVLREVAHSCLAFVPQSYHCFYF